MHQVININGAETVIEIPDSQVICPIKIEGSVDSFKIEYGNNLTKVGGIVTITTVQVPGSEKTEGNYHINFEVPFTTLLDYQCTALDNNTGSLFEHAHLGQVTNTGLNIYAQTVGTEPKSIKVKWYAEGVI